MESISIAADRGETVTLTTTAERPRVVEYAILGTA